jgi:two-component system OmpR family sensor kinase
MILDESELADKIEIINIDSLMIETDFELFALALKNLIDNAIKYSTNSFVEIEITENGIKISNRGDRLKDDLSAYREPFCGSSNGLGLGLYIVLSITEILRMELVYKYEDGFNLFYLPV